MFVLSTIVAIIGFSLWGKSNLNHYDEVYGLYAEQFYSKAVLLQLIKNNEIDKVKDTLEKEVATMGTVVALCLMNDCSKQAKKVRDEYQKP